VQYSQDRGMSFHQSNKGVVSTSGNVGCFCGCIYAYVLFFFIKYYFDKMVNQNQHNGLASKEEEDFRRQKDLAKLTLTEKDCYYNEKKLTTIKLLFISALVVVLAIF